MMTPLIENKVLPPEVLDLKQELEENMHELGTSMSSRRLRKSVSKHLCTYQSVNFRRCHRAVLSIHRATVNKWFFDVLEQSAGRSMSPSLLSPESQVVAYLNFIGDQVQKTHGDILDQ